jgi:hypothetical protein
MDRKVPLWRPAGLRCRRVLPRGGAGAFLPEYPQYRIIRASVRRRERGSDSRLPESSIRRGCGGSPMVDCGRLLLNRVGALRFALAEGDVFAGGLDQVDEDIIGRDSCRGCDAGVQVLKQRQSRLS